MVAKGETEGMGGQQLTVSGCCWSVERSGPGVGLRTKQRQETALPQRERDGEKLSAGITRGVSLPGQVCASH